MGAAERQSPRGFGIGGGGTRLPCRRIPHSLRCERQSGQTTTTWKKPRELTLEIVRLLLREGFDVVSVTADFRRRRASQSLGPPHPMRGATLPTPGYQPEAKWRSR